MKNRYKSYEIAGTRAIYDREEQDDRARCDGAKNAKLILNALNYWNHVKSRKK